MTNNNPHVRSYMNNKEIQEYINEHNNRLNSFYNPKPINISNLFITYMDKFNLLLKIWLTIDNNYISSVQKIMKVKELFKIFYNY